jgi:anti-anti-sigma regulatory factor
MSIRNHSDDIVLVSLPRKPGARGDLQRATELVDDLRDCSVVVDFSRVDVAGGAMLSQLLQLRRSLQDHGRRLVLCGVAPATRGVFAIARVDTLFDFVKDRCAAVAYLAVPGRGTQA